MSSATADRFWDKVRGGDVDTCWEWTAATTNGYGTFYLGREGTRKRFMVAHRWSYLSLRGDIPEGLVLDHLCRNRSCVNPWHLEPVTPQLNAERGEWGMRTHCPSGHPYDAANTGRRANRRSRECITCRTEAKEAKRYARRKALLENPALTVHGRVTTYTDWMCRCDRCREAATEDSRRRRRRSIGEAA